VVRVKDFKAQEITEEKRDKFTERQSKEKGVRRHSGDRRTEEWTDVNETKAMTSNG
jgi:hypothetical protein